MFRGFVQTLIGIGIVFSICTLSAMLWFRYRDNPEDVFRFEQKKEHQEPKRDIVLAAIQPKPPRVEFNHAQRLQHVAELTWQMLQARELFEQFTDPYGDEMRTATPIPPWEFDQSRIAHQVRRALAQRPESEKLSALSTFITSDLARQYREIKRLQAASDLSLDVLETRLSQAEDHVDAIETDFRFYESLFVWIAAEEAGRPAAIPPEHRERLRLLLEASISAPELEQLERIHMHDVQLEQFYRSAEAWQVFGKFALDTTERAALERAKSNPEYDVSPELLNIPRADDLPAETFGTNAFASYVGATAGDECAERLIHAFQCCSKPRSVPSLQAAWESFALHAGPSAFLSSEDLYFLEMKFLEDPRANRRYRGRDAQPVHWKRKSYWPFVE